MNNKTNLLLAGKPSVVLKLKFVIVGFVIGLSCSFFSSIIDRYYIKHIISKELFPYIEDATFWDVSRGQTGHGGSVAVYEAYMIFPKDKIQKIISDGFYKFKLNRDRDVCGNDADSDSVMQYQAQLRLFGLSPQLGRNIPITGFPVHRQLDFKNDSIYFSYPSNEESKHYAIIVNATNNKAWAFLMYTNNSK